MSKELETTLKISVDLGTEKDEQCAVINLHYKGVDHIIYETHDKEQVEALNKIKERLESIDNAEPSEALEKLEKIKNYAKSDLDSIPQSFYDLCVKKNKEIDIIVEIIQQALLKAQEQEKVLEIIKKKNVDIIRIKHLIFKSKINPKYWDLKYYNETRVMDAEKLTQEEFDLLKEFMVLKEPMV